MEELQDGEDFEAYQKRTNLEEVEQEVSQENIKSEVDSEQEESDGIERDEDGLFRGHRSAKSLGVDEDLRRHRV